MLSLSTYTRNAILETITTSLIDATTDATLVMFTGQRPSSPDMAYSGDKLISFKMSKPSFAPATSGAAVAYDIQPLSNVLIDGEATWFRIYDGNGVPILDGEISDADGSGDILLNNTNMTTDGKVSFTRLVMKMPVGI